MIGITWRVLCTSRWSGGSSRVAENRNGSDQQAPTARPCRLWREAAIRRPRAFTRFASLLSAAVALAVALPLTAQRATWIVDAAGGPGSQFREIQPAIDAARPGDLIRVRPGGYARFSVGKGVSILGPGARVTGFFIIPAIDVRGLPAGQSLVLSGFATEPATGGLLVDRCDGAVLLHAVQADRASISESGAVVLREVAIGSPSSAVIGLQVTNSDVVVDRGGISGGSAGPRGTTGPAVSLWGSRMTVSRATIIGGAPIFFPTSPPSPAVTTDGASSLWLLGDGTGLVGAGGPAVDTVTGGGTLIVSPAANLVGTVAASVTVRPAPVPSLAVDQSNSLRTIDLSARAGSVYATVLGVPASAPVTVPGVTGAVWFDLAGPTIVFDGGVVPNAGRIVRQYSSPTSTHLVGLHFVWQSVTLTGGALYVSNPSGYALSG